jgi:hypothetical protein
LALRHILPNADHILTVGNGAEDFELIRGDGQLTVTTCSLGVFQHHNRVCASGQHPTGVDQGTLTGTDLKCRRVAHGNFTD